MNLVDTLASSDRRVLVLLIAAALAVGIGTGFLLSRHRAPTSAKSDAPIEWNKVQAVPTRAPDAQDVQWQERANALDEPSKSNAPVDNDAAEASVVEQDSN